ncbi:MAG: hypothetical protein ACLFQZ_11025 [Spirochaetaceae bacterium]
MPEQRNRLIGLALFLGGLGSSVYGYLQYRYAASIVGVAPRRVFDPPSPELTQAVVIVIAGLAVAVVGAVLLLRRR